MSLNRNQRLDRQAEADRAAGVKVNFPVSTAEIEAAMLRVMEESLRRDPPVIEIEDFRRALVPKEEIEPRFNRLLAQAKANLRRR